MNQIRNLCIIALSNIIVYVGIYYLLDILVFKSMSALERSQALPLTGAWILTLLIISIINFAISAVGYSQEFNKMQLFFVPPLSGIILIFIGFNYIIGNIKKFSTVDFCYIGRYSNRKVYYYMFTPFCLYRAGYDFYSGSDYDYGTIKESLSKIHENYINEITTPKDRFKEWDGTLDTETKRIKAIKNIID